MVVLFCDIRTAAQEDLKYHINIKLNFYYSVGKYIQEKIKKIFGKLFCLLEISLKRR